MNQVLGYAIPSGVILVGMLSIVLSFAVVIAWPRPLLFAFLVCMFLFASSSGYGFEDATDSNVFWVKGSRSFFFTFIEMGLFGAWLAMLLRLSWERERSPWLPTSKYYLGLAALLLAHALAGLTDPQRHVLVDLSQRGFSNVLLQGMFVALIVTNLRTERDFKLVMLALLVCLAGREAFGLVRYAAFGGDPQNAYAVLEARKVKITFWDINDSVLAAVMFALCTWRLLTEERLKTGLRLFLLSGAAMALLIPMLSARRTAQSGMMMAILGLSFLLPRGRRWPALVAMVLAVPLVVIALGQRSGLPGGDLFSSMMFDVKVDRMSDSRYTRFHELEVAWNTLKEQPIFGLGPSGSYKVSDHRGLEYHAGRYDYVHSGFGHMALKGGILGLLLYCAVLLALMLNVIRHWRQLYGAPKALSVAALAGLVAGLPNMFVGTPIPELRTMLLMGFLMALTMAAGRFCARNPRPVEVPSAQPAGRQKRRRHGFLHPTGARP